MLSDEFRRRAADGAALPMFCLSLAYLIIVAIELYHGFIKQRCFVLPFWDVQVGFLPFFCRDPLHGIQQLLAAFAQGDEVNAHLIDCVQVLVCSELGIKDQRGV